jgi:Protein of unknown function (DUF2840)
MTAPTLRSGHRRRPHKRDAILGGSEKLQSALANPGFARRWREARMAKVNEYLRFAEDDEAPAPELTHVDLLWIRQRVENRIRFGKIDQEHVINRRWRVVSFAAGSVFAFVRWAGNAWGTVESRIDILRAVAPGEHYITVPDVRPGGESLLQTSGWPRVEKVLQTIEAVEALRINPADVAPDYWRHVHNRLSVGDRPQTYTRTRHQAWLRRKRVMS